MKVIAALLFSLSAQAFASTGKQAVASNPVQPSPSVTSTSCAGKSQVGLLAPTAASNSRASNGGGNGTSGKR